MLKIVEFDRKLLENFVYDGIEQDVLGKDILPIAEFYNTLGTVYLGVADGKVIGLGGVFPLWPSTGGCFLFLNKEVKGYTKSAFKSILEYMDILIRKYNIKTLSVECLQGVPEAASLIEHLGFTKTQEIKIDRYARGE